MIEPLELVKVISPPKLPPLKALIEPVCRLFREEMLIFPPPPPKAPNSMFPTFILPDSAERVTFPTLRN